MEPFFAIKTLLALCLTVHLANSVPLQWESVSSGQCATRCRSDPQFIRFTPGKTYNYKIQTKTLIEGATGQDAVPVLIDGAVVVSARSQCDLALQMAQISIRGVEDHVARQMAQQLEATPLYFGYSDGHVTDVCPLIGQDVEWALNVKKAVVSALQMTSSSLQKKTIVDESDVLGDCRTEYEPVSARYGKHVLRRVKNLRQCSNQQQWLSGVFPRAFQSTLNSIPLISGKQICEQLIESDLIVGATCREQASVISQQMALPSITSELNLRFESARQGLALETREHVIRRHAHHLKMSHVFGSEEKEELVPVLREMCQTEEPKKSVELFQRLLQGIKLAKTAEIENAFQKLESHEICASNKVKDLFVDACAQVANEGAVKVVKREKNSLKSEILFQEMAFAQNPTKEALKELLEVLEEEKRGNLALLGISGFIHNLKQKEENDSEVKRMSDRAIDILLKRALSGGEIEKRVVSIKAIENIGLENNQNARQQLARLASSSGEISSVRAAALKCLDDVMTERERETVIKIFENSGEKNEMRILAYKAIVMSGATQRELQQIKRVLDQSHNDHVTQYVLSHQKNLRETSDPHKRQVTSQQQQKWAEPKNQWWGVSNNFEGSVMIDALGMGAVFEADVIYEEKAPKSVNLNLTLPLFGREIQVLEIEFRQKGFEREIQNKLKELLNVKNAKHVFDTLYSVNTWSSSDSAWFEMSVKIDGKNLIFFNSKQKNQNFGKLLQQIKQTLSQSQDSAFAFQPINTRVQLPSTNGWPMIARINATLLTQIKSEIRDQRTQVSPSLVWNIESGIEFRAHNQQKSVGVSFVGQSEPEWDSRHEISSRNLNLKVLVSKQKISLIKSEINLKGIKRNGNQRNGQKICSDFTKKPFGLALCFEQNSNSFEVFVEKWDKNLKSIEIQISRDSDNKNFRAMFNTPNSDVDRHLEAELQLENQSDKRMAKASLRSPWIRYSASAQMRNDEKEQSIGAEVTSEGKKVLVLDLALEQQSRGQKREFRPRVRVQVGEREAVSLQGTVGISKGRKNQLQINLEGNQKQFLKGSFVREGERKSSDIRISSDVSLQLFSYELRLNGLLDKGLKHVTSDLAVEYRCRNQRKESAKISLKVQNLTQSALMKMSAFAEVTSTQFPQYNAHVAYNLLNKPEEHVENELTVQWNQKLGEKVHLLQLTKVTSGHVENTLNVEITPLKVNYELRANGERSGPEVSAEVMGKDRTGNKENDFKAQFAYKHVQNKPLHLTLNANLKTAQNQLEYSDELREQSENDFKGLTQMAWQSRGQEKKSARMDYEYKIKSKKGDLWHEMKMQLTGLSEEPIKHQYLLRMSRDVKQVKAKLNNLQLETLLTNQGPSKVEWAGLGYQVRAHAQPYTLPQSGMLEVATPFGEHKTSVEMIARQMLKLKSDTKKGNKNLFAIESEISSKNPSKIQINSPIFGANFNSDLISNQKSLSLDINHVTNDWTHSSQYNSNPLRKTIEIKSKTATKGRNLLSLDSALNPKKSFIEIQIPTKQTKISAFVEPNTQLANLQVTCGPKFQHQSQWKRQPEVTSFTSTQSDFRSGLPLYSVQFEGNNAKRSLKSEFGQNYGLEGEWTGSGRGDYQTGSVALNAIAKRQEVEHKSKVNYGNDFYHFSSKTTKSGNNLAEIESKISTNHNQESLIKINAPFAQSRATLVTIPAKSAKIQISRQNSDHVTSLNWSPNYSLDSKTTLNQRNYQFVANHAPKTSFASFKSPEYDISGHVDRDSVAPSAKIQLETRGVSHVTEVSADRNRKSIRIESKTDRNPEKSNVYRFDTQYNHWDEETPSSVNLKIGRDFKIHSKINAFNRQKREIQIQVEHPNYNHVTNLEYQPRVNHVTLRSRTDDVISGRNLAKVDSFLSPRDKSHVTIVSQSGDCNLEFDPKRSARFELNNNEWKHRSAFDLTPEGVKIDSKTKRFGENYLDLNSLIARDYFNDNSHLNLNSPQIESKINLIPKQKTTKIVIKTPSIDHQSEIRIPGHVIIDSKTLRDNQLWNKVKLNSENELDFEIPYLAARGQWSPNHVVLDYKNKLPHERHLLASIRVNPKDSKGFHVDFAWDQQKDPNQRVSVDYSARQDTTSGWNERKTFHSLSASYAGNEIQLESQMSQNVIYGPHEWTINYVPKYNANKDSMELKLRHEISRDQQMECQLEFKEGKKEKLFATLKTSLKNNTLITSFTTRAPQNPEMEVKVLLNARATNWRQRNAELMAEVKAVRATKQYSYSIGLRRINEKELKTEVKYETPSSGEKSLNLALDWNKNEITGSLTGSEGKKAEVSARYESRGNGEKHVSLELKSNVDSIPSVSVSGDLIPEQEVSLRVDSDGARKAEVSVIRTGSVSSGLEVIGRAETEFLPKIEFKSQLKKNSREIDFEFNSKVDSKQVLSALLKSERVSDTWTGEAHVSQNGAEVMNKALESTFGQSAINYVIRGRKNVISPLKVTFSAQTQNRERKVLLNACAEQNTCLDVSAAVKRSGNGMIEKMNLIVSKVGTNFEIKTSLNEEIDEQTSGQSLLGLTSGRTQWKRRNEFSVSINGHSIGFNALSQSRGRHQREDHVTLQFPNRKEIQMKSDFTGSDEQTNHVIRIEDNVSSDPILETRLKATQNGNEVNARLELSSKRFRKSPKTIDFRLSKPTNQKPLSFKLDLNLSQNPNNALTLETIVQRVPETSGRQRRYLTSGSALNNTIQVVVQSRDKKKMDFELNAHASTKTLGFLVRNSDKRGNKKHALLFVKQEETSGQEKRFKAIFETNSEKYTIDGALQRQEKEVSATWRLNNEKNGEKSEQRVAIGDKCVTWESRARENRKYELCLNSEQKSDKTIELTIEETSSGGIAKHLNANLEVDKRDGNSVKLDINWTPEALKQWIESAKQTGNGNQWPEVLEEIYEELSEKYVWISRQMSDDVIVPLAALISDEFSDLFQELIQSFGPFQRLVEISEQIWYKIQSLVQNVSEIQIFQSMNEYYKQGVRSARKQCRKSQMCYQLIYSLENYGIDSVIDWTQSNIDKALEQSHRLVMTTSGRLYRSLPVPQWVSQWTQYYQESMSNVFESIIESNADLQSIFQSMKEMVNEITKDWNSINKQKVKELVFDLADTLVVSGGSSSRVVVWDPQRGRLSAEIKSPIIGNRLKRSISDTSIIDAKQSIKSMLF